MSISMISNLVKSTQFWTRRQPRIVVTRRVGWREGRNATGCAHTPTSQNLGNDRRLLKRDVGNLWTLVEDPPPCYPATPYVELWGTVRSSVPLLRAYKPCQAVKGVICMDKFCLPSRHPVCRSLCPSAASYSLPKWTSKPELPVKIIYNRG